MSEIRENYDHFDANSDGFIDKSEFGELCAALGAGLSDEEVDVGFDAIDLDGNGVIDFDEFQAWWSER